MDVLCFAIAGVLGFENWWCKGHPAGPSCDRYIRAFNSPDTVTILEDWRRRLPKRFDASELRKKDYSGPGYRPYQLELDFDPARIGLGAGAKAQFALNEDGEVHDVIVSDTPRVMFVFRADYDAETFKVFTVPEARGANVGVTCFVKD